MLCFQSVDSTNAYAKRNCSLLEDQTVIVAHTQTAGRGRLSRSWLSEPGGLYFSVLLKPQQTDFLVNLTQLMALSVAQVLRKLGAPAVLKWPNDVLVNGQKICGILSEAVAGPNAVEALILGTGVNVAQTDLAGAGQPATSLKLLGIDIKPEPLLAQILDAFFAQYPQVLQNGFEVIRPAFLDLFPYIGQEVTVRQSTREVRGRVQTISAQGTLQLQTPAEFIEIAIGDMTA